MNNGAVTRHQHYPGPKQTNPLFKLEPSAQAEREWMERKSFSSQAATPVGAHGDALQSPKIVRRRIIGPGQLNGPGKSNADDLNAFHESASYAMTDIYGQAIGDIVKSPKHHNYKDANEVLHSLRQLIGILQDLDDKPSDDSAMVVNLAGSLRKNAHEKDNLAAGQQLGRARHVQNGVYPYNAS